MAMVVDPTRPAPELPEVTVSPDGILQARADPDGAGVLLYANLSAADPQPRRAQVIRTGPDGTQAPVRSGDLAWAPGGIAVAYDAEAPCGSPVAYAVTGTTDTGAGTDPVGDTPTDTTDTATAVESSLALQTSDPPLNDRDAWIKSVSDPGLSQRVTLTANLEITSAARVTTAEVIGRENPVASWDVLSGSTGTLTVDVEDADAGDTLAACLNNGVCLFQANSTYPDRDMYFLPGDVQRSRDANDPTAAYTWTIPFTAVDRPATIDAPLRIPGRSYAHRLDEHATYSTVPARPYLDATTGGGWTTPDTSSTATADTGTGG